MSRPEPDPVLRAIARAVQRYLVVTGLDLSPLPEVTAIEAHPTGELATGIVITMADQSTRYFIVRVAEFTTR